MLPRPGDARMRVCPDPHDGTTAEPSQPRHDSVKPTRRGFDSNYWGENGVPPSHQANPSRLRANPATATRRGFDPTNWVARLRY
jgi:hypothetical protein